MINRTARLALTVIVLTLTFRRAVAQSTYERYRFTTFAGVAPGSAAPTGSAARFGGPDGYMGVAVDSGGNVYVADQLNNTVRKVTPGGVVTTLAGLPGTDETVANAPIVSPSGVAVDGGGNVYVVGEKEDGFPILRKVTPAGVVTTLALCLAGGPCLGRGSYAVAAAVATDSVGNVYVADIENKAIRKISPEGLVTTLIGESAARLNYPNGLAVDAVGNVFVSDDGTIRRVTPAGVVTTLAGPDQFAPDGAVGGSEVGLAADNLGNIYLADTYNNTIRKVTSAGVVTTLAGLAGSFGFADGAGSDARFNYPSGLAIDSVGNIYVGDLGNGTIRKVTPAGVVTTLAGLAGHAGSTDATGTDARFGVSWPGNSPTGVAVDSAGNLYVTDNNTIRKITPAGAVTTLAGLAGTAGTADGTGSAARFSFYLLLDGGVAVDSVGNVYVTDGRIRKITPTGVVTTLAAPPMVRSSGIAVDSADNLYVAEKYNNTILKITSAGVVTTLAGLAGTEGSKDGAGSAARFSRPTGVAVDALGNVYVADAWNATIRKVTPAGVVTTLAGRAGSSGTADGTGSDAFFGWRGCCGDGPSGVAVDYFGNVYVADTENNMIRKVTPAGVVTTLAGLGHEYDPGGSTDGTGSDARFARPFGIAIDSAGTLYVVDSRNNTVRKGSPALLITASGQDFGFNGGQFGFNLTGPVGRLVVVEASTDLLRWLPVWTNTFTGAFNFSDPQSGAYSNRFYRAHIP